MRRAKPKKKKEPKLEAPAKTLMKELEPATARSDEGPRAVMRLALGEKAIRFVEVRHEPNLWRIAVLIKKGRSIRQTWVANRLTGPVQFADREGARLLRTQLKFGMAEDSSNEIRFAPAQQRGGSMGRQSAIVAPLQIRPGLKPPCQ